MILVIIIIELVRPKPLNWHNSYTSFDKIPFGSYVLAEELPNFLGTDHFTKIPVHPFEFLSDSIYKQNSTYFFINDNIPIDLQLYTKLQQYLEDGNTVFASGKFFGNTLLDSLKIKTETSYALTEDVIHPVLFGAPKPKYLPQFKKKTYTTVFKSFDTLKTKALGYFKNEKAPLSQINFIKIKQGAGTLYLHTLPEAFSNYYMLTDNQNYAANCLSYTKNDFYYWDTYIKSGRKEVSSPLRFVLSQVSLRWAYYLFAIGLLLFVLFKGKREQRIIPIVTPLKNTSIEFTQTIGDLYLQHQDYSNIIHKKITYFLEKVRSDYYLDTSNLDATFITKLAHKSTNTTEKTEALIQLIKNYRQNPVNSEVALIKLNKAIEEFIA